MPSSDPFDDDDIFSDPAALNAIAAIEERAFAASQAPKRTTGYHHTITRPGAGPRAGVSTVKPKLQPASHINGPRSAPIRATGGQHGVRGALQAQQAAPPTNAIANEESPMDVVVNDKGHYGFAVDEDPIIDQRTRPEIRQLVEAAPLRPAERPKPTAAAAAAASQARREAIFGSQSTGAPMKRTTSSTSTGGIPNPPRLGPARTLARSISTGNQVFGRNAAAGPSRAVMGLPPIASQGSQPASQGQAARRAVFELEEERRLREASEAEVRALRSRLAAIESGDNKNPWQDEISAEGRDWETEIVGLKQQLWTAQGQASNAKRNQETTEAKLLAEIEKLRGNARDMETQMKTREQEAKQRIETMKTQAVFSNHNAFASASKVRQQSQLAASQQRGAPTPMRMGSPLRDKSMMTPAPLTRSVKGKARAPPPPRFDGLTNAFNITPTIGARAKRQRAAAEPQSPMLTPPKRRPASSPVVSPVASQGAQATPDGETMEGMDWQPDFEQSVSLPPSLDSDPRAELIHHLLNHVACSRLSAHKFNVQPTIFRILTHDGGGDQQWTEISNRLVRLIGDTDLGYEDFCHELLELFAMLLGFAVYDFSVDRDGHIFMVSALRLIASTLLLFPSFLASNPDAATELLVNLASALEKCYGTPPLKQVEFEDAVAEVSEAVCLSDGKSAWAGDQLALIILKLIRPAIASSSPFRALDIFAAASYRPEHFRALVCPCNGAQVPVIDQVARFLAKGLGAWPVAISPEEYQRSALVALSALFALIKADPDATLLIADQSVLVPALLMVIHRESSRIWGVRAKGASFHGPLELLTPAMILMHHLVYPPPLIKSSASQLASTDTDPDSALFANTPPQGVDLARKLQEASSTKEFSGVQHVFVSTLGAIAYAEVDVDDASWAFAARPPALGERDKDRWAGDLRTVQFLAQDLLDAVVEGPEGDNVYEIYVSEEDHAGGVIEVKAEEVADAMDVEDYGDEEAAMGDGWAGLSDEEWEGW